MNTKKSKLTRRDFLRKTALAAASYPLLTGSYGMLTNSDYQLIEQKISITNLPEKFKGFTIGMLSDIHSSPFMLKEEMDAYVKAVNELKTDMIVVTGDFVNSQTEEVYPFAEAFSNLTAPYGVYGCLGNHDYFADVDIVAKEIDECGVKLLRNDAIQIHKENSFINLIGVDDIGRKVNPNDYLKNALSSINNTQPKILLCHKPYYMDNFAEHNIDLTLSGHTHGGQIVFGNIDNIAVTFANVISKYVRGLYKKENSQMYVNRGIGTSLIAVRINCPPEITKITLM